MTKLKIGLIPDDKPVKLTVELPAELHRDLIAYGDILGREAGQGPIEPKKLVVPMIERFIATDRGLSDEDADLFLTQVPIEDAAKPSLCARFHESRTHPRGRKPRRILG